MPVINMLKNWTNWILCVCLLTVFQLETFATHNRAGEITYKHISGYTYEFTVHTYTYLLSLATRNELNVSWGDGTHQVIQLADRDTLPNYYLYNTYVARHTFPGAGIYEIYMEDPNRNLGVKNIPNSVNTIFSIKTTMLVGPFTGSNSTPILLNPPIDKAALGHIFIHNPGAFDPDGDSLSYALTICTAESGKPIAGYTLPPTSDTFYINSITGDLTWKTPVDTGVYNVALYIDEWRNGIRIGRITRDMQIDVYKTDNNPPLNSVIPNYCVEAGDTLVVDFSVTDPDNDFVTIEMVGGPLLTNRAEYEVLESRAGYTRGRFTWRTNCSDAQNQPISIVLKSQDIVSKVSLVDITSFQVKVIHNAPKNPAVNPGTDTIGLSWIVSDCGNPEGYRIYRKVGAYGFIHGKCEYGVPEYTGYELWDVVKGRTNNHYIDDNHGAGLVPGFDYCYMITAYYGDNAESFASAEVCTTLIPGIPSLLQVSVEKDGTTDGEILVSWAYPHDFDTIDNGPYQYRVYRMEPGATEYSLIDIIPTDLSDTTYIDDNINTLIFPYYYSVKIFYQEDNGDWTEYPGSEVASSLYLKLKGSDNSISIENIKRSPWMNYQFNVFRRLQQNTVFDSIGYVSLSTVFIDNNLPNNVPFTYRTKALGERPLARGTYYTINKSHLNTTTAVDSVPPCAPISTVVSYCDSSYNVLTWTSPQSICGENDIVTYQIYYSPTLEGALQLIGSQNHPDTTFIHSSNLSTLAGVYGVVAVDSFSNTSAMVPVIIDSCIMYWLPNVFSPDNDGKNDVFLSYNLGGFVQRVNMQIFNRYGQLVYSTEDPDISWDGYNQLSKRIVSSGVYYYICDVFEPRLTGEIQKTLKGFIHVFSGKTNSGAKE